MRDLVGRVFNDKKRQPKSIIDFYFEHVYYCYTVALVTWCVFSEIHVQTQTFVVIITC